VARARSRNRPPERDSLFGAAILSAALHATLLVAALVVWPYVAPPLELPSDIVPVELLDPGEETNIAPQEKAEEPPPEPPEPEQLAMELPTPPPPEFEPPPPPPIEDEAPALEPEPEPEEPKPEPAKPEPPPQRFAMATPRAKPRPQRKKEEFNLDKIISSLDNVEQQPKDEKKSPPAADRTLKAAGAQSALSASEIAILKGKLAKCWNVPVGAPDPAALVFRVRFSLNEDGTVAGPPQLLDQGRLGDPYFRAAADAAIRAIQFCGPYELPPEKYAGSGGWNEITIEFDPRKMAGY